MNSVSDSAHAPEPASVHHFQVTADLCPQALLRILGLVAQQTLIPVSIVCERHEDELHASIAVDGLSSHRAEILLAKISAIVAVRGARLAPS